MEKRFLPLLFAVLTLASGMPDVQHALRSGPVLGGGVMPMAPKVEADLCPLCIQFTSQAINQLLNIILNAGVVGTCGTICNALAQKTGSQVLGAACNILCDIAGVEEFVKLVEKADLDPIYFCEELKTCPVFDSGDALITKLVVTPATGPQGERLISFDFASKNGTGTGEWRVYIQTVDGIPVESSFLQESQPPGSYNETLKLKAEPDPNCDPTQGPCEQWLPGNYTVEVEICNGECGSKHPHSQVYDKKQTTFVIGN
ncbi:countin-1 [Aplysia californica]|uniref:Countin-1 n=1 Tax=Aplysia californica TaxID=6500 RepID=A0ABM1A7A3_APLCA|nr:countin-1 [Aplysia californica]